ncbi:hypothetical protein ES703_87578 [subsurface metagenome]
MPKCNHVENRNNECKWEFCPRGLFKIDWEDLMNEGCGYMRKKKKKRKEVRL